MNAMRMLGYLVMSAIVALALAGAEPALAQTGQELYAAKGCVACHGPDGKKALQPTYPNLASQNGPYLVLQLKAFKTQERKGPQAMLMWGMAAQLSDGEIEKIAEYLAGIR